MSWTRACACEPSDGSTTDLSSRAMASSSASALLYSSHGRSTDADQTTVVWPPAGKVPRRFSAVQSRGQTSSAAAASLAAEPVLRLEGADVGAEPLELLRARRLGGDEGCALALRLAIKVCVPDASHHLDLVHLAAHLPHEVVVQDARAVERLAERRRHHVPTAHGEVGEGGEVKLAAESADLRDAAEAVGAARPVPARLPRKLALVRDLPGEQRHAVVAGQPDHEEAGSAAGGGGAARRNVARWRPAGAGTQRGAEPRRVGCGCEEEERRHRFARCGWWYCSVQVLRSRGARDLEIKRILQQKEF